MAANGKNGKNETPATVPMFTIRQALAHLADAHNVTDVTPQALRNAIKNRAEFKVDGAVTNEEVEGTDIRVLRVSRDALDAYAAARKSGTVRTGRGGAATGAGVYYRVRLTPDALALVSAAYPDLTFEPASIRKRKGDDTITPADTTEDHSEGIDDADSGEAAGLLQMELTEG